MATGRFIAVLRETHGIPEMFRDFHKGSGTVLDPVDTSLKRLETLPKELQIL